MRVVPAELRGPVVHLGHRALRAARTIVGRLVGVPGEQAAAERQLHPLGIERPHLHPAAERSRAASPGQPTRSPSPCPSRSPRRSARASRAAAAATACRPRSGPPAARPGRPPGRREARGIGSARVSARTNSSVTTPGPASRTRHSCAPKAWARLAERSAKSSGACPVTSRTVTRSTAPGRADLDEDRHQDPAPVRRREPGKCHRCVPAAPVEPAPPACPARVRRRTG